MPTTAPMLSLLHVFSLFHSQTICALLPGSLSQSCHFQYEQTHPDKNTIPKTFAQHYEPSKALISYLFRNSFLRPLPRVPRHPRLDFLRSFSKVMSLPRPTSPHGKARFGSPYVSKLRFV